MAAASFRWILQQHKDVPKAARFYSEGLDFTVHVCTLHPSLGGASVRSTQTRPHAIPQVLIMFYSDHVIQKGHSSLMSFTVTDINQTMTKLMSLGAELDGPIKYEIHGKVAAMRCLMGTFWAYMNLHRS